MNTLFCPCGCLRATLTPARLSPWVLYAMTHVRPVYCFNCGETVRPVPESIEVKEAL